MMILRSIFVIEGSKGRSIFPGIESELEFEPHQISIISYIKKKMVPMARIHTCFSRNVDTLMKSQEFLHQIRVFINWLY